MIHFTQTHIVEVKEILNLLDEYGVPGTQIKEIDIVAHSENSAREEKENHVEQVENGPSGIIRGNDFQKDNLVSTSSTQNQKMVVQPARMPNQSSGKSKTYYPKEETWVRNKKYGQGKIVKVDPVLKRIEVEFTSAGKKIFVFPICFENGFLKRVSFPV